MKYLSLFSGIGTGEQGIEQAFGICRQSYSIGPRADSAFVSGDEWASGGNGSKDSAGCIGFAEIDRHAEAIYRYHRPEHVNLGDATAIVPESLPDFDFLIAGFPCQSFSIAGKRQGFNEARGTLFFEIARILSHKRPSHFLLENVRGLVSHDGGQTIDRIIGILTDLDYFVESVVLNSKDYGVPQNRERIFFIGHSRSECSREILSIGQSDGGDFEAVRGERPIRGRNKSLTGCLDTRGVNAFDRADLDKLIYPMALTETRTEEAKRIRREMQSEGRDFSPRRGKEIVCRTDNLTGTVTSTQTVEQMAVDKRIRRLTPVECERLQGLPDHFTALGRYGNEVKEVSDTQRYKGLGNAFTVNVIEAIVTRMLEKGCLI